jgi:methyl-accepting chemotaxis protein
MTVEKLSIKKGFIALATLAIVTQTGALLVVSLFGGGAAGVPWAVTAGAVVVEAIVIFGFAVYAGSNYAGRAEQIVNALHLLAEGNLRTKLKLSGRDDFAWLAYEYDCARKSLVKLITELSSHAQVVSDAAGELAKSSESISTSTHQQSDAAATIAAAVEELAVSVSHVADNAREARDLSILAKEVSRQGTQIISGVVDEVGFIAKSVQQSSTVIEELGRQSVKIRSIVKVIDEVADQTNLLALNAAIEAARAGEQGRGFAVVADEVRKLAERTGAATKEIQAMVESIAGGTVDAVGSMKLGVEKLDSGVALAQQAGAAIGSIDLNTQKMAITVEEISSAIEEQRSAADEIARQVELIAQMASSNSTDTEQTGATAKLLAGLSAELESALGRFKI